MARPNKDIPRGITPPSVADMMEFESWTDEQRRIARAYYNTWEDAEEIRHDGYEIGYNEGYQAGYRAGRRKAEADGETN